MKEQRIVTSSDTRYIAFLSRLVNFAEDVVDDAECDTIYVSRSMLEPPGPSGPVEVRPVRCRYDPAESIEVFGREWDIEAVLGRGDVAYTDIYGLVLRHYRDSVHVFMASMASRSLATRIEYFLAVFFNGEAVLLEGETDRVTVPFFRHCLSSHTHPARLPFPSQPDLRTITRLFLERGIAHIIETVGGGLAIYRVGPITEDDLVVFREAEALDDPRESLRLLGGIEHVRISYI